MRNALKENKNSTAEKHQCAHFRKFLGKSQERRNLRRHLWKNLRKIFRNVL